MGQVVDVLNEFRAALGAATQPHTSPELIPTALSRACVDVLPVVAGAAISLTGELRVLLGASDAVASKAEHLQTALGEGPCLTAAAAGEPLVAGLDMIAAQWPILHRELVSQTPFRSVVTVPLLARDGITGLGALDLFLTVPEAAADSFADEVADAIAAPISSVLFAYEGISANPNALPPWLHDAGMTQQMHIGVAVGILMEHAGVSDDEAMAALRVYTVAQDDTLDGTATRLMSQDLRPGEVLGVVAAQSRSRGSALVRST